MYAGHGKRVGLRVGRILDIAEATIVTRSEGSRPGVLFTAVVQDRVTEFLDVEGIIRMADPSFFILRVEKEVRVQVKASGRLSARAPASTGS